ncbi:hypothetical protein DRJ17_04795 [Candidatus Woesearchaeota archaeon]|nr:MAG: hypothetical protein DRJ17_04795 [Candidatus Woesearchaeota archaeon]
MEDPTSNPVAVAMHRIYVLLYHIVSDLSSDEKFENLKYFIDNLGEDCPYVYSAASLFFDSPINGKLKELADAVAEGKVYMRSE